MFTPEEISYSSAHRELITILYSLSAFGNNLHNSSIKWYTGNQATAKIVDVGFTRLVLQMVVYEIFTYCLENHIIDLHIEWIPRALNRQADFISKIRDCDDWQTTRELFDELNSIWGPYAVDCFSSYCNNKVDKFYSRFWNSGCAGVDALYQSWAGENCWLVPPVNIHYSQRATLYDYISHTRNIDRFCGAICSFLAVTVAMLCSSNSRSSILYRQGMLHAR